MAANPTPEFPVMNEPAVRPNGRPGGTQKDPGVPGP
jgi:hypothetical protein